MGHKQRSNDVFARRPESISSVYCLFAGRADARLRGRRYGQTMGCQNRPRDTFADRAHRSGSLRYLFAKRAASRFRRLGQYNQTMGHNELPRARHSNWPDGSDYWSRVLARWTDARVRRRGHRNKAVERGLLSQSGVDSSYTPVISRHPARLAKVGSGGAPLGARPTRRNRSSRPNRMSAVGHDLPRLPTQVGGRGSIELAGEGPVTNRQQSSPDASTDWEEEPFPSVCALTPMRRERPFAMTMIVRVKATLDRPLVQPSTIRASHGSRKPYEIRAVWVDSEADRDYRRRPSHKGGVRVKFSPAPWVLKGA
jgi:hypothetical protein